MKLTPDGTYRFTGKEHVQCMLICILCFSGIGWLIYDRIWIGFLGIVTYGLFYKISYKYKMDKYQKQLRFDFKDMMLSVYSSLSAGTTLEIALRRTLSDMERSLAPDARILQEMVIVCQKMDRNVSVHQCLDEMAKRCMDPDMSRFFHVLSIGKRQGGNMPQLVRESVEKIQRRIEMSYEIKGIIGLSAASLHLCA